MSDNNNTKETSIIASVFGPYEPPAPLEPEQLQTLRQDATIEVIADEYDIPLADLKQILAIQETRHQEAVRTRTVGNWLF
jgi:hypothetical protein